MASNRLPPPTNPVWPCVILGLFSLISLSAGYGKLPTADEIKFLQVGQYLAEQWRWDLASTTVHAPLSFYTHGVLLKPFAFDSIERHLFAARAIMSVYAWVLGLAVYAWARQLYGARAGLLALLLWATLPDTLAHSALITTDIILACWITWATFAFWRWSVTGRWRWVFASGYALGCALLSKYSAALWVPMLAVLAFAHLLAQRRESGRRNAMFAGGVLGVFAIAYVVLCIGYAGTGISDSWNEHAWASDGFARIASHPVLQRLPILFPLPWLQGIDYAGANSSLGHPGFLLGEKFLQSPWYFQAVSFLYKVPIPFLVLLLLVIPATKRIRPPNPWALTCVLGPPIGLFAYLSFFNDIAAGFRYSYPLLPALCIALGRFGSPEARMLPQVRQAYRTLVGICVVAALYAYPNYLSYVNAFQGVRERGYEIFADSNIDWSQNPPPLDKIETSSPVIVNPGPIPVPGRVLINVNTYQDVFTRCSPHTWVRGLPVVAVHDGIWLEIDAQDARENAPPLLRAIASGDVTAVSAYVSAASTDRLSSSDCPRYPDGTSMRTVAAWMGLAAVERGDAAEARAWLGKLQSARLQELAGAVPSADQNSDGENAVSRNNAAVALLLSGETDEAIEVLSSVTAVQPLAPGPYANLAIAHGTAKQWQLANEAQREHNRLVQLQAAKPFHSYRVHYGRERILLGALMELWPQYTTDQLHAEEAWALQPTVANGLARVEAYQRETRLIDAGLALLELQSHFPDDSQMASAQARWDQAATQLRARGDISD